METGDRRRKLERVFVAAKKLLDSYPSMPQVEFVVGKYPFTREQYLALCALNNEVYCITATTEPPEKSRIIQ